MRRMKRALLLWTLMAAVVLACSGVALAQSTTTGSDGKQQTQNAKNRYIVVLKDDVSDVPAVAEEHRQNGAQPRHTYQSALKGYSATIPDAAVAAIQRDPRVQLVDKDLPVKADQSSATGGATGVDRVDAEPNSPTANDGSGAGVAVIDTGIDETHPDLSPNVVKGINTLSPSGRTTSSDGTVNCTNPSTSTNTTDDNGHGTHVAGTIGAKNDGVGVVGVAPGATLYAVKVLNSQGSGYTSDIICGIDWVTNNAKDATNGTQKIHAANMSIGGTGSDDNQTCTQEIASPADAYKKAICKSVGDSGVTYVVSAGNDGANLANKVPAAYRDGTNPLVLTVTAIADSDGAPGGTWTTPAGCTRTDEEDTPANFSNYATTTVDQDHTIPAPGVCIKSTWKGGAYNTISGTSMASPHIAGTVALCLRSGGSCSSSGATTPGQIIGKLRSDAQTKDTSDGKYGFQGDPTSSPTSGHYYGYLEYAGDYRSGSGGGTTPPPSQTVPLAPSNLAATRSGSLLRQSIKLTWTDNASNEDNFTVERSTDQVKWDVLTSTPLPVNTTSYTDKTVSKGGITYYYRVRATNGAGSSDYSNTASAKTR